MTVTALPRHTWDNPPPHGDTRRYRKFGCRCPECREGVRLQDKRRREHRATPGYTDATGTTRRVRALIAYGYGQRHLAGLLDCTKTRINELTRPAQGPRGVLRRTAERIRDLYDQLLAEPEPTGRAAAYARTVARRHGWHHPDAWNNIDDPGEEPVAGDGVDEVLVQRVLAGGARYITLNPAERILAYRVHRRRGGNTHDFQRAHSLSGTTISRLAASAREAAA